MAMNQAAARSAPAKPDQQIATVKQRLAYGQSRRKEAGRKMLGLPKHKRSFDPIALLLGDTEGRRRDLLPVKYSRMSVSPFSFFRGAVAIMAADLAQDAHTGILTQLCGDAHVQNLGSFGAPDGSIVFDINDFDETVEGPWEWDVKRMSASIALAGSESGHDKSSREDAIRTFASAYCGLMAELAKQPVLTGSRHQIRLTQKADAVSLALKEAERATPLDLVSKYIDKEAAAPPHFKHIENALWPANPKERAAVMASLDDYRASLAPERLHLFAFFRPIDVAFKVVGTGSVGLRDYVVLLEGNGPGDPLFLQIKQEVPSAYSSCLGVNTSEHQGRRVVIGQRRIQPLSDPLLGWTHIEGHDYLVRQLNDHKGRVEMKSLAGDGLGSLAQIAGQLLARGHARSGDPLEISGYIGKPDRVVDAMAKYGLAYAKQTEADYDAFTKALKAGKVKAAEAR